VSFRTLVAVHKDRTFRAALRVLANRDEALDVTQEAFLALHRHAGRVPDDAVGPWLVRVATNRSIDRVRRRKRARTTPLSGEVPAPDDRPAESAARAEEHARVRAALAKLPERQRQVLAMRVMEQRTFVELSRALGISEGAAKVHFRRGLAALRARLAPDPRGDRDE